MELLFVDETDRQQSAEDRAFFCICGLSIDSVHLITANNELESIKKAYGLSNLKDARKSGLSKTVRLEITQAITNSLLKYEVKVRGIVLGDFSLSSMMAKEDIYMGAMSFLLERFTLHLVEKTDTGLVIFDTVDGTLERNFRKKFWQYIQDEVLRMAWEAKPVAAFRDYIHPAILFADDNHSALIQSVDLIATCLNSGIVNSMKGGADAVVAELPTKNEFLQIYWPLFMASPGGKVEGWGVKIWH